MKFIAPRKKKVEEEAQIDADKEFARRLQLEEAEREQSRRQKEREEAEIVNNTQTFRGSLCTS